MQTPLTPPAPMWELQLIGAAMAAIVGLWVAMDAVKRGKPMGSAISWGLGVFLAMIVFLPLYLFIFRNKTEGAAPKPGSSSTCRYCGGATPADPDFCPHCSKQLKGSDSIHRRT